MNITSPIQSPVSFPASLPAAIAAVYDTGKSRTGNANSFRDSLKTLETGDKPAVDANATTEASEATTEAAEEMSDAAKATLDQQQQRLKKAGQEFEALFFSMMLKEMRNSISSEEGGGMFAGEGSDTFGGMFDTFIGQHMATSGQLGIAKAVETSLNAQATQLATNKTGEANSSDTTKDVNL